MKKVYTTKKNIIYKRKQLCIKNFLTLIKCRLKLLDGVFKVTRLHANPKCAFTFAEVLITLGIIGVVAAMTLPTITANANKKQVISQVKKNFSILNQGLRLSEVENGEYKYWNSGLSMGAKEYFEKYYKPYFKGIRECTSYSDCGYSKQYPWIRANGGLWEYAVMRQNLRQPYVLADGTILIFSTGSGTSEENVFMSNNYIYFDINGPKKPNQLGKDVFIFIRTSDKGIQPDCYNMDENSIDNNCSATGAGTCCAAKLIKDGWEFKNNYPY